MEDEEAVPAQEESEENWLLLKARTEEAELAQEESKENWLLLKARTGRGRGRECFEHLGRQRPPLALCLGRNCAEVLGAPGGHRGKRPPGAVAQRRQDGAVWPAGPCAGCMGVWIWFWPLGFFLIRIWFWFWPGGR